MGRGGGRGGRGARTQRRHFRQNRENVWKRSRSDPSSETDKNDDNNNNNNSGNDNNNGSKSTWEPFATQNPSFDEFYKEQGIVSPEEWDSFIGVLRTPLPAAFRINSSSQFYKDIRDQLENDFMISLQAEVSDGGETEAIRPLPWYPENLAWHSNFSRMQLRKNQNLERFHEFLKMENEIGNITRQEAVSMVPPLFLGVSPDHFVLDMCAAPGSKTFQLLEIVYHSCKSGSLPNGLVIANDLDVQRCNLLIHQTKRMCTANLIVTNHEAQHFPGCRLNRRHNSDAFGTALEDSFISQLQFDRVLCDVPCSGDGTLRKAPDIWRKWNAGMGNGLHCLQVLIAMRGLSLLKVGGRMVYSTCSMNPIENEAVVAEILRKCGGSVELLDVSNELPQLVRRPGLKKWKVRDKGVWLASYKDVPKYRRSVVVPSMFPSGRSYSDAARSYSDVTDNSNLITEPEEKHENGGNADLEDAVHSTGNSIPSVDVLEEEVSDFPLERCMRIVPHDQNTGAFFIAVFQKNSPLPAVQEKPNPQKEKRNNEPPEDLPNEVIEYSNGLEASSTDVTDGKSSEAASEVDLIDDKLDEVVLAPDLSVALEENSSEAAQASGAKALDSNKAEPDLSVALEENSSEAAQASGAKALDSNKAGGKRKIHMQGKWKGVDPVVFFRDEAIINSIKTFYGIDESFPLVGHLLSRNLDNNHVKRIYYVSKSVKDVLELNFSVGQQLKIASIGLKMFERQTSREGSSAPCSFRISSEGLPVILPYITKQILHAFPVDFKHLLQYKSIKYADFVDSEFGKKASDLMQGCCVVVLRKDGEASSNPIQVDESTIAIGCWKGKASLTIMVTAIDCEELLERLVVRIETEKGSSVKEVDEPSKPEADEEKDINDTDKESMKIDG
ncbi:tRNA (cytosine(34)-C(5))-methyltransferase isoform X2 [Morus notabilis]|uniref:tRNA (cytosine(34)-C(5))-methyltransferase isoform X2 n=1 Tax=Morus notabilis TaxID=981085 RepID=UPI000CECF17A|nr:tRNA (cytosine(34)-C(5))-methyltransferase isoform X2 [Morus notabilis]